MTQCIILLIPLLGTSIGAAMVFFMRDMISTKAEKLLLGFAAGVMIAASVWSLLLPSIESAGEMGIVPWLPALTGLVAGILFLVAMDLLVPFLHPEGRKKKGTEKLSGTVMMMLAVTIHNIPEGMAVGVTCAGAAGSEGRLFAGALALSIGIAIQNIPEGAIISMPLRSSGMGRGKAFLYGVCSGVVEPVGAFATVLLTERVAQMLPFLLAFAAGAMFYVVIEELVPEAQSGGHSYIGTIGAALGFGMMMVLDVAL